MSMQWYDAGITQHHNAPDDGIDLGTPNDTPLTSLFGGKVIEADYKPWGGEIFVGIPGTNYSEGFLHVDQMNVKVGDTITAGQQIGTSGGGVGDLLLKNGTIQAATTQADFGGYSTGYHTEYDLFQGQTSGEIAMDFNAPSRQLNPEPVIQQKQAGLTLLTLPTGGAGIIAQPVSTGTPPPATLGTDLWTLLQNLLLGTGAAAAQSQTSQLATALNGLWPRLGFGALGATLIAFGLASMIAGLAQTEPVQSLVQSGAKVAEVAAL